MLPTYIIQVVTYHCLTMIFRQSWKLSFLTPKNVSRPFGEQFGFHALVQISTKIFPNLILAHSVSIQIYKVATTNPSQGYLAQIGLIPICTEILPDPILANLAVIHFHPVATSSPSEG